MIDWHGTKRVLYRNGHVYAPAHPFATAIMVDGAVVAWIGDELAATAYADIADEVVDCQGMFIAPGFVDAHVHATASGLARIGLDLRGIARRDDVLAALQDAASKGAGAPIFGHGWDETSWDDSRPLTRQEIDRATWGSVVFLSRIDVHSAVVSSALLAQLPGVESLSGYREDGLLSQNAHHRAREAMLDSQSASGRRQAQRAFRELAAEHGVVSAHEMAGPIISSFADAQELIELQRHEPGPLIALYWGAHVDDGGIETAQQLGAIGAGGDLFVDGSIGSHTACLHQPYADKATAGVTYLTAEQIGQHIAAATSAGLQAGFHVIGDRGMTHVVEGIQRAIDMCGIDAIRQRRHRLEHAEMMSDADRTMLQAASMTVSMQPLFDELWGGSGGMYEQRLGVPRGQVLNDFAAVSSAGLLLALGSDSPVTEVNPWAAVRAAVFPHHQRGITPRAAFHAHTRGGWRAISEFDGGVLTPGAPAHLAIWQVDAYASGAPDERVSRWSTDPRSGTPDLPDLTNTLPTCVRTIVHGAIAFDSGEL
jgi:predicted amidohydrolase YtcJ